MPTTYSNRNSPQYWDYRNDDDDDYTYYHDEYSVILILFICLSALLFICWAVKTRQRRQQQQNDNASSIINGVGVLPRSNNTNAIPDNTMIPPLVLSREERITTMTIAELMVHYMEAFDKNKHQTILEPSDILVENPKPIKTKKKKETKKRAKKTSQETSSSSLVDDLEAQSTKKKKKKRKSKNNNDDKDSSPLVVVDDLEAQSAKKKKKRKSEKRQKTKGNIDDHDDNDSSLVLVDLSPLVLVDFEAQTTKKKKKRKSKRRQSSLTNMDNNDDIDNTSDNDDDEAVMAMDNNSTLVHPRNLKESTKTASLAHGTCVICLEDMKIGEMVVWSENPSCPHVYHKACIVSFLANQKHTLDDIKKDENPCPTCRQKFVTAFVLDEKETCSICV